MHYPANWSWGYTLILHISSRTLCLDLTPIIPATVLQERVQYLEGRINNQIIRVEGLIYTLLIKILCNKVKVSSGLNFMIYVLVKIECSCLLLPSAVCFNCQWHGYLLILLSYNFSKWIINDTKFLEKSFKSLNENSKTCIYNLLIYFFICRREEIEKVMRIFFLFFLLENEQLGKWLRHNWETGLPQHQLQWQVVTKRTKEIWNLRRYIMTMIPRKYTTG